MERLEYDTKLAIEWFENNYMNVNEDKCHLLVAVHRQEAFLTHIQEGFWTNIGKTKISESKNEKLLGLTID